MMYDGHMTNYQEPEISNYAKCEACNGKGKVADVAFSSKTHKRDCICCEGGGAHYTMTYPDGTVVEDHACKGAG